MAVLLLLLLLVLTVTSSSVQGAGITPEQVHISVTGDPTEMVVMWTTFTSTNTSMVQYGEHGGNMTSTATGKMVKFVDGGKTHTVRYMHTATLTGLNLATKYDYKVGCSDKWSNTFTMTTLNDGTNWSPRLAIYGDMGSTNARSLTRLSNEADAGHIDAILHIGDFAYNFETVCKLFAIQINFIMTMLKDEGKVGDDFMNEIQDIATQIPYMTTPGNHEEAYNFSHYINRFTMPGGHANYYYSWDVGSVHFILFSTEVYFFIQYGPELVKYQYEWLEKDLKEVTSRKDRPWIITGAHRPMYCSTRDGDDCDKREGVVRTGYPTFPEYGLEKLFYDYGVDIELWAHEHEYQRMWPVYNRTVYNGSVSEPYVNPKAPVHLITGSAGCREYHTHSSQPMPWDAVRYHDYGYSHLTVYNSTHVRWQQISDDKGGKAIDDVVIVRNSGYPTWL